MPWLRVDRLLGGLPIPKDSAAGRAELENYLEGRRAQEEGEEFKPIRRGWCLGNKTFRQELLEQARVRAGENHYAEVRRETTEEKARRILCEELDKPGWSESELAGRPKGDARKIRIAQRLRAETSVTLKWIAVRLKMGTWTHLANRLHQASLRPESDNQTTLELV